MQVSSVCWVGVRIPKPTHRMGRGDAYRFEFNALESSQPISISSMTTNAIAMPPQNGMVTYHQDQLI